MTRFEFEYRDRILVIRYPKTVTLDAVVGYYSEWDHYLARERHAVLIDLRRANPLTISAPIRRAAAAEVEKRRAEFNEMLIAEARVISGAVTRGVVTAFDFVVNRGWKRPLGNFENLQRAEAFLQRAVRGDCHADPRQPSQRII